MRFLYLANIRLPTEKAHGLQIMKTCEALAKQGIEIELVIPRRLNRFKDDPFAFYGVEKNFKITKVWCLDLISLKIFGSVGFWIESWTFYLATRKYLRKERNAIYYTRDLPLAYWLSKKVSPVYYEIHTLPDKVSSKHKEAWQRCKGLIVISNGLKTELAKQGVPEEKILKARDAVDLNQFKKLTESKEECREKIGVPNNQKIVVYTGHLYEWKGAGLLAETTNFLPSDVHVYLVGGTPKDIKRFRKIYRHHNLHIIGWLPHQLMPYWHKAADVLVLPNSATKKIGSTYTSPLKLFEYMASGNHLVVADLPALHEILKNWPTIFFKPDDSKSLSEGIIRALNTASPMKAPSLNLLDDYTWDKRAQNILKFLRAQI